eukprot:9180622-Karenia_brevis.AAC.1
MENRKQLDSNPGFVISKNCDIPSLWVNYGDWIEVLRANYDDWIEVLQQDKPELRWLVIPDISG